MVRLSIDLRSGGRVLIGFETSFHTTFKLDNIMREHQTNQADTILPANGFLGFCSTSLRS